MDTPSHSLLPPGTPVRVLTQRHRDQIGTVVAGPGDGAWNDLVVWVDLGQHHPVPLLPQEVIAIEPTLRRADSHPTTVTQAADDTAADPVAAGLAALRTWWPDGLVPPE